MYNNIFSNIIAYAKKLEVASLLGWVLAISPFLGGWRENNQEERGDKNIVKIVVNESDDKKEIMQNYFPLADGNRWTYIRTIKRPNDVFHYKRHIAKKSYFGFPEDKNCLTITRSGLVVNMPLISEETYTIVGKSEGDKENFWNVIVEGTYPRDGRYSLTNEGITIKDTYNVRWGYDNMGVKEEIEGEHLHNITLDKTVDNIWLAVLRPDTIAHLTPEEGETSTVSIGSRFYEGKARVISVPAGTFLSRFKNVTIVNRTNLKEILSEESQWGIDDKKSMGYKRKEKYLGFAQPNVINDDIILGLKEDDNRALWRYSSDKVNLEKIADLPINYSSNELQIANEEEYAYHKIASSDDGLYIYLEIDFNKLIGSWVNSIVDKRYILNTKTRQWEEFISNGYFHDFIPKTHKFVFMIREKERGKGNKEEHNLIEFDCDSSSHNRILTMKSEDALFPLKRIKDGNKEFEIFSVSRMWPPHTLGYWNSAKPEEFHVLNENYLGKLKYSSERFFSTDGKYVTNSMGLWELVGADLETKLLNLHEAKELVRFPQLTRDCIGWCPDEDLIAFVGRFGYIGIEEKESTLYASRPDNLKKGEMLEKIPRVAIYNKKGERVFDYSPEDWELIEFAQWYNADNLIFYRNKRKSIDIMNIKGGETRTIIDNISFRTSEYKQNNFESFMTESFFAPNVGLIKEVQYNIYGDVTYLLELKSYDLK